MTEDERRGGRKCASCWWYAESNAEQKARFVQWQGVCLWRPPPIVQSWGGPRTTIDKAKEQWCSCWEPNLASKDL